VQYDISASANLKPLLSDELIATRRKVAEFLLHFASSKGRQRHLSQSEMVITLGISRNMVNNSLISLKEESAIRVDRHKIAINKNKLEQILISKE
jgi:CRP-like cAMP-binding protein